jgi:hypothetical protein
MDIGERLAEMQPGQTVDERGYWKEMGPRKKFAHFFRRHQSLCGSWAVYNTPPTLIMTPYGFPSEKVCKRCQGQWEKGIRLFPAQAGEL